MEIYFLALGLLLLGALLSVVVKERFKFKVCSVFSLLSAVLLLLPAAAVMLTGVPLSTTVYMSPILGDVNFVIDPLSAFFVIVISIMSFLGTVYANGYMKPYFDKGMNVSSHCFFLMMLIMSMTMVVTVQNALFFLIVWELMSLSSFFLVIFEGEKKEVISAGIKYLVYMHLSVIFIIAAFVMLNIQSNSLNFADFAPVLQGSEQFANIVFFLAFLGFGIKAGFVPFHNWLPDAHPAAPSHVSAIMSGVMIKTGLYGILRILFLIGTPSKCIAYTVFVVALVTALYGILYALAQRDLKKLLAYSSIENIGIIGLGIGLGMIGLAYGNQLVAMLGFAGGILHILNHSIFKELMFFGAGSVYNRTHTRDMEVLGGLIKKMPNTASLFIIGAAAISGLPPFNGFISEFLIYFGMLKGTLGSNIALLITLILAMAGLAMVGTMAMLCFTKAASITFLGQPRNEEIYNHVEKDVPKCMWVPMALLAVAALAIGMMPQVFVALIMGPISMFVNVSNAVVPMTVLTMMQILSICFFILAVLIIALYAYKMLAHKKVTEHTTWGCGYNRGNAHVQYTGASYVSLFLSTLKPLFKRVTHIKKPKELFPKEAHYEQDIEDIEEAYIVKPLIKWDEKLLSKFERIQSGNIQQYIAYGLAFLVLTIVCLVWFGGLN